MCSQDSNDRNHDEMCPKIAWGIPHHFLIVQMVKSLALRVPNSGWEELEI